MKQIVLMEQAIIPISSSTYYSGNKSNYANYQGTSMTKEGTAMVDVLENAVLLFDEVSEQTN